MRSVRLALALSLLVGGAALADDIVTMPTANQLKKGEVDVAAYYLWLSLPDGAPQFVQYQTLYLGLTDRIELDVHRAYVDTDKTSYVLVGSYKALAEGPTTPDLVFGVRNFTAQPTTNNPAVHDKSSDPSVYLAGAKTFFLKKDIQGPPLVRAHLVVGSSDWTLLGEKRHEGFFGGLQFLLTPWLGAVVQHDGTDWITGVTLMPLKSGLTFKGGSYGKHAWAGVAFRKQL
jgi:hypothetical protein